MLTDRAATGVPRLIHHPNVWRYAFALLLAAHGLIHLMGVTLLWKLGQPAGLRYSQVHPAPGSPAGIITGAGWLIAAALFVAVAVLLVREPRRWHPMAMIAAVLSAAVLTPSIAVTVAGFIVDIAVLAVAATISIAEHRQHRRRPR